MNGPMSIWVVIVYFVSFKKNRVRYFPGAFEDSNPYVIVQFCSTSKLTYFVMKIRLLKLYNQKSTFILFSFFHVIAEIPILNPKKRLNFFRFSFILCWLKFFGEKAN